MIPRLLLITIFFVSFETCYSQTIVKKNLPKKVSKKSKPSSKPIIPLRTIKFINDYEELLTISQSDTLLSIIKNFEQETSIEIVIVSIGQKSSTAENFDSTILKIHNNWGVGKVKINNGIVIGISSELRKIRISNGVGVREKLSDEKTKIIIDEIMIPQFKENKYYLGLLKGLTEIINILK
jgi:uncharacterized protein